MKKKKGLKRVWGPFLDLIMQIDVDILAHQGLWAHVFSDIYLFGLWYLKYISNMFHPTRSD